MSSFQFLASDKPLQEVKNPYIEFISINEAVKRNIALDDFILEDEEIDRDDKMIMICDSEEHLDEIEISNDIYYSLEYAKEYSNKPYFSQLQWRYTKTRAKQIIDYLKEQWEDVNEIEIWDIWLDEHEQADIKSVHISELTLDDLKYLDVLNGYEKPTCLIIKR